VTQATLVTGVIAPVHSEPVEPSWFSRNRWWITRTLVLPVHLLVFSIGVFFLIRLIPGDPVLTITGGHGLSKTAYAAARKSLGLDGNLFQQLGTYLSNLAHLNLGQSLVSRGSVFDEVMSRLPQTLELALLALAASLVLTVVIGQIVVMYPYNPGSRFLAAYARAAGAIPDFVMGVAGIFVFYALLNIAPAPLGLIDPLDEMPKTVTGFPLIDALIAGDFTVFGSMVNHLVLPVLVMAVTYAPMLLKLYIRSLGEQSATPSTHFRVATGVRRSRVYLSAIRRAAPPVVALCGAVFGYLIGGAVVVEELFAMPGMGQYAVDAVNTNDLTALQGALVVVAALSLVVFLIVDLITMALDPRRRPGTSGGAA
jgi:ABC-type dipeptide/oligopeptide/nickel transport system permease component